MLICPVATNFPLDIALFSEEAGLLKDKTIIFYKGESVAAFIIIKY